MERQQHQHWVRQPRPPLSTRSRQPIRTSNAAFRLNKPVALSLVILGSAWVVVLVIAVMAVNGLLSPSASNGHRTPGAAIIRDTAETSQTNSQARIPLWLFGAVALSCAAGSMLIAKQANRPPRPRKSIKVKRLAPFVMPAVEPSPSPIPSVPQPKPPYPAAVPSFVLNQRQTPQPSNTGSPFMAPPTLMQLAHQETQSVEKTADVSVTVVPSGDQHPLDWGEASLADRLDIRKQRSISSFL
jgi:hypothetical protein